MLILTHGKVAIFNCDACGCTWLANRLDVELEFSEANQKTTIKMKCPDCGMPCTVERDFSKWTGDLE